MKNSARYLLIKIIHLNKKLVRQCLFFIYFSNPADFLIDQTTYKPVLNQQKRPSVIEKPILKHLCVSSLVLLVTKLFRVQCIPTT